MKRYFLSTLFHLKNFLNTLLARNYRSYLYNKKQVLNREDVQVTGSTKWGKKILYSGNGASSQVYLRSNTSDYTVFKQVLIEKQYEAVVRHVRRLNIQVNTIFDCGANIGLTTLYFHQEFPEAKYVCIEPDTGNFEALKTNAQINNIEANLICAGVWSHNAYLKTNRLFRDGREWSIAVSESAVQTDLRGVSITALIKENRFDSIDILKIDIEGAESVLFQSKNFVTEVLSLTKIICLEVHEEKIEKSVVEKSLRDSGFEIYTNGELTIGLNLKLCMSA